MLLLARLSLDKIITSFNKFLNAFTAADLCTQQDRWARSLNLWGQLYRKGVKEQYKTAFAPFKFRILTLPFMCAWTLFNGLSKVLFADYSHDAKILFIELDFHFSRKKKITSGLLIDFYWRTCNIVPTQKKWFHLLKLSLAVSPFSF